MDWTAIGGFVGLAGLMIALHAFTNRRIDNMSLQLTSTNSRIDNLYQFLIEKFSKN